MYVETCGIELRHGHGTSAFPPVTCLYDVAYASLIFCNLLIKAGYPHHVHMRAKDTIVWISTHHDMQSGHSVGGPSQQCQFVFLLIMD